MGKYNYFVGQQWVLIALILAGGISSLMIGMLLPWQSTERLKTSSTITSNSKYQNETAIPQASIAQQNHVYKLLVNQLQQEATKISSAYVPQQFQGKVFKAVQVSPNQKVVALTFDDGPWPKSTDQILAILKKNNIKATFFMVGEMVQNYPQYAKDVLADGHTIANHTWHHWYRRMDETLAASEINRTADIIYKTTGVKTSIFRPPGGVLTNGLVKYAQKQNYAIAMWSADAVDYRRPPAAKLASNVLRYVKPGGIVLMHDGGGDRSHTVQALPIIIASLKKQGFKFATVPELLDMQTQQPVVATKQKSKLTPSSKKAKV